MELVDIVRGGWRRGIWDGCRKRNDRKVSRSRWGGKGIHLWPLGEYGVHPMSRVRVRCYRVFAFKVTNRVAVSGD